MRTISDTTRSNSVGSSSGEDRDLTNAFTGKDQYQEIIKKAESFPLLKLFKKYSINIDSFNRKSVCPFSFHKGGKESTASFYFYPETNTFWCYGCKSGTTSVDFLSKIENSTKIQAAIKIIQKMDLDSSIPKSIEEYQNDYEDKNKLFFEFSKKMREMISFNPKNLKEIEEIYSIFDRMNDKYELEYKALQLLVSRLTDKLNKII